MDYDYAHNDTSSPERPSRTAGVNKLRASALVEEIRKNAFSRAVPVSSDETLQFVCLQAAAKGAKNILEIGSATGASGIALLQTCTHAHLTTIEKNASFADEARANFQRAGLSDRATLIEGDAAEALVSLCDRAELYDFIFLDGPKVQYIKYLPVLKKLMPVGGLLLADDVLLYGWVNGEQPVPKKRHMLVEHIREYLDAVQSDEDLLTYIADVGDGIALSVKLKG